MDVASDQEPLLGDTERGVFVANQRISVNPQNFNLGLGRRGEFFLFQLKKSEVHALKGGRGIVQVLVQDPVHTAIYI
eukprot:93688-Amorphochlora_amoeboformis.AAC.2